MVEEEERAGGRAEGREGGRRGGSHLDFPPPGWPISGRPAPPLPSHSCGGCPPRRRTSQGSDLCLLGLDSAAQTAQNRATPTAVPAEAAQKSCLDLN